MRNAVTVDDRQQRAEHAARDAAVVQREVVEVVERSRAERAARARVPGRFGGRRQRRHLAVRRIDDQRRVAERADAELVAQERADVDGEVAAGLVALRALRKFFRRQRRAVGLLLRTIHRDAAEVVGAPNALEARVAPRGARRPPALVDISRGGGFGGDGAQARRGRGRVFLRDDGRRHQSRDGQRERRPGSMSNRHRIPLVGRRRASQSPTIIQACSHGPTPPGSPRRPAFCWPAASRRARTSSASTKPPWPGIARAATTTSSGRPT